MIMQGFWRDLLDGLILCLRAPKQNNKEIQKYYRKHSSGIILIKIENTCEGDVQLIPITL